MGKKKTNEGKEPYAKKNDNPINKFEEITIKNKLNTRIESLKKNFSLKDASKEKKKDEIYVLESIKIKSGNLYYADDSLKKDKVFIKKAYIINPDSIYYADYSLKKDRDFCMDLINSINNRQI